MFERKLLREDIAPRTSVRRASLKMHSGRAVRHKVLQAVPAEKLVCTSARSRCCDSTGTGLLDHLHSVRRSATALPRHTLRWDKYCIYLIDFSL